MAKQASSSSEGEHKNHSTDDRKRKRMISNRESAKRSRMRKEKHIKDLNFETTFLNINNKELVRKTNSMEQQLLGKNIENQKLEKERAELAKRLESLEIVSSYVCGYEKENLQCSSQTWQLHIPHQTMPLISSTGMFNFE